MICKIWGVKAHIKSGITTANIKKGLVNMLNYVDDNDKIHGSDTENPFEMQEFNTDDLEREIHYINTSENFYRIIDYMADEHKIKNTYISGYLCDPEHAIEQFMLTKIENLTRVGKELTDDLGNQGFHIVQSFPDDLDISDEEVHQCGVELCQKLKVHQAVITSHLHPVHDKNGVLKGNCKHNHILINSHINPEFIDPKHPQVMKYHDCKESYALLRAYNDEIAIEHGLPVIITNEQEKQYSWYEKEMDNEGKSWTKRMMYDLENAMNEASDWEEYKALLSAQGYQIKEGKYETYTAPDKVHKARGKRLGHEYTKAYMQQYWDYKSKLHAIVETELKEYHSKNDTIDQLSANQIAACMNETEHKYHTKIPRIHKYDNSRYELKIPLRYGFDSAIAKQYIKDDLSYPLYNEEEHYLGNVIGRDLKEVIFAQNMEQYLKFKHWEEEETHRTEQEELKAILKKSQKEDSFSIPGWNHSKTNVPYRIGLYDNETGRRRSLIEHILIFAMVVINKEVPEFTLSPAQKEKIKQADERLALIIAPASFKSKKLLEAMVIAKEEDVKTLDELKEKLNAAGKNYQKAKSECQRIASSIQRMQPISDAILICKNEAAICEEIFALENGAKKDQLRKENDARIKEYTYAKGILYQHNIHTEKDQNDFINRFAFMKEREETLSAQVTQYANRYTRLKKLKYQIDLSLDKEYCYSKSKDLDKYHTKDDPKKTPPRENDTEKQKS